MSFKTSKIRKITRVLVNLDSREGIFIYINLNHSGVNFLHTIDYKELPFHCHQCHQVEHVVHNCMLGNRAEKGQGSISVDNFESDEPLGSLMEVGDGPPLDRLDLAMKQTYAQAGLDNGENVDEKNNTIEAHEVHATPSMVPWPPPQWVPIHIPFTHLLLKCMFFI